MTNENIHSIIKLTLKHFEQEKGKLKMTNSIRTKVSRGTLSQNKMVDIQSEKIEMTLNTDSALASGLLIQRLTELYENPIEASVRETVSNGLDAVAIGYSGEKAVIRIERPSRLNPILSIADNGPGMSYEDLKNVYSKYGASTKQDNFDQIGAYGLGAKAPLAYGTQFTVSSVNDGVKTVIIVAREEMTNYIKVISSTETDEPSGTVVSIPVNSNDIEAFNDFVSKYEENPADYNADFYIDGVKLENESWDLISDDVILLQNDTETVKGRIWISSKEDDIVSLFTQSSISEEVRYMNHIIGGWSYPVPSSYRGYGGRKARIAVELKPGLVSFNSSRDNILSNERYQDLQRQISKYLLSEEFAEKIVKKINKKPLEKFTSLLFSILRTKENDFLVKGTTLTINSNANQNKYLFNFEKLVHEETGYCLKTLTKDVPTVDAGFYYTKEESHSYYKKTDLYSGYCTRNEQGFLVNRRNRNVLSKSVAEHVQIELSKTDDGLNALAVLLNLIVKKRANENTLFITDIAEDKYREVGSKRKSITNYLNNISNNGIFRDTMIVYTTDTKENMTKMLETAEVKNVLVKAYDELIAEMKEYSKANKVKKEVKKSYQPTIAIYQNGTTKTVEINVIKNTPGIKKIVVLSKDRYVSREEMAMISNWYCNTNDVEPNTLELYASSGQHRVMDLEILEELEFEIFENKHSKGSGTSKAYEEKIAGRFAEYHSVLNSSDKDEMLYILRLAASIIDIQPRYILSNVREFYRKMISVSETLNFKLEKLNEEKYETLVKKAVDTFGDSYSTRWSLGEEGQKQIIETLSKENLELIPSLVAVGSNNRTNHSILIEVTSENKIEKILSGPNYYVPSTPVVETLNSDTLNLTKQLEKNRLEMLCKILNELVVGINTLVK